MSQSNTDTSSLSGFPAVEKEEEKSQAQQDYEQGMAFLNDKESAQAAAAFHNALLGFEQDNDEKGMANASMQLADICLGNENYEQALKHCASAEAICASSKDTFSLICIKEKKAKIYSQWSKYSEAIKLYIELVDDYNKTRNPQGTVNSLETLAELYLQINDKEKAADSYNTIANIHKSFKHVTYFHRYEKKAAEALK
ncbi:MAG TPA: tetratricopeptide repeat protein [Desulfobacterales bacterium]|nr:tetratricopeptide repeat protein [Desulfobacterales bacterium]